MKLCIPIKYQPQGGMYSFISNFTNYLQVNGIPYTDDIYGQYDVLFVNSWVIEYDLVRQVRNRSKRLKVVQRVDGSARDYGRTDGADERQAHVNMLADLTIFQSKYSRYSTRQKFKVISQDGPVIYNPVNTNTFCPEGETLELPYRVKVCHATFSTNPKKGVRDIYQIAHANADIDFILCGQYENLPQIPNVHSLGVLRKEQLAQVMRSCDLFMFLAENESCPNVVLEAMSSGLPILYKDSGGTQELVGDCGYAVEVSNFQEQLEKVLCEIEILSAGARDRAVQRFSSDVIFPQYLRAIERTERKPLPTTWHFIGASLRGYPVIQYRPLHLVGRAKQSFARLSSAVKEIRGRRQL